MTSVREVLIWVSLAIAVIAPLYFALTSPLLAWRDPVYILAGVAGVIALVLLLFQPLFVIGVLPGLSGLRGRRLHRWFGASLVLTVVVHVVALWITSPPDVIDVLTFTSPTPFSVWGVVAMWAVFAAGMLAAFRHQIHMRTWRLCHSAFVLAAVLGGVAHAMLIEGTMENLSKAVLCMLALVATMLAIKRQKVWALLAPRNGKNQSDGH